MYFVPKSKLNKISKLLHDCICNYCNEINMARYIYRILLLIFDTLVYGNGSLVCIV